MIPEEKVSEVAERTSIVEIVSDYVQLRRAGANFLGLCPFHAEKTPSFNVNPAREIYHCFGCGAGGNVFSFIMRIEGISFPEAVKLAARKAGVEIEERQLTSAEKLAQSERQTFQQINEIACNLYRDILLTREAGTAGRTYLGNRSVDKETEEAYRIGFAPDKNDTLVQKLRAAGIDLEIALKLGIVKKGDRGWYDQFRNRLLFPIRDAKGSVIAFAGRVLDASLPKYINSPESPLYHKSSVLFGLDLALPAIRLENAVIIVEGYFDHLALYQAGVRNVVATCGTALTDKHAALIKRHAERVFLLFDGDNAGQKAAIRSMELFMEQRLPSYLVTLPNGEDPDSFLTKNPVEAFRLRLEKARPTFESYIHSLLSSQAPDSVDSKVRIIDELLPRFKKIADPIERDLYENEICRLLGITVHAFRKRMGGKALGSGDLTDRQKQENTADKGDSRQEMLLAVMCSYPEALTEARQVGLENLFSGDYLKLAAMILATTTEDTKTALQHLFTEIDEQSIRTILSRILVSDAEIADIDWKTAFKHCRKSQEKQALFSIKEIAAKLAITDSDSPEYQLLIRQAEALRTRKSKIQP